MSRNEALLLGQLSHPNIVRYYESKDVFLGRKTSNNIEQPPPTFSYLRTELLSCSFEQILDEGFFLNEQQAVRLLDQLSSALNYLHKSSIAHHDLTPSNILLDRAPARGALNDVIYKIADFSSALAYPNPSAYEYLPLGSGVTYFAPEKASQYWLGYSPLKADIFSLALIVIEGMANFSCPQHRERNMAGHFGRKLTLLSYRGLLGKHLAKELYQMTDAEPAKRKLPSKK